MALRRPPGRSRSRWFANYIDLVVDKDVMDISRVRQREMLPRLLGQLAARSGQVLNITPVAGAIGLERSTAENYVKLLEAVFLIYRLPAWGTTLGSRVVKHAKVHMVDSGVMAWLLSLTPQKIAQSDPSTLTEYGHLLETFAVGEILKQVSWSDALVAVGYFRTESGDEVDLVLERDDGQVIAFEIKAGTRVSGEDLRGLRLLKTGWPAVAGSRHPLQRSIRLPARGLGLDPATQSNLDVKPLIGQAPASLGQKPSGQTGSVNHFVKLDAAGRVGRQGWPR